MTANPVRDIKRQAVRRYTGVTAAFDASQARDILDAPLAHTVEGLRNRAILSVVSSWSAAGGSRRHEGEGLINMGFPSLRYIRKGGN